MKKFGYPEVVVGAFIVNRKGYLLLARSFKWPGIWSVPGGHVEHMESVEHATKREVLEEVGMRVRLKRIMNVQEVINPKAFHRKAHFIFIDALCTAMNSDVRLDNKELYKYVWVKPKDSLRLKLNTYTRRAIMQLVKKDTRIGWFDA